MKKKDITIRSSADEMRKNLKEKEVKILNIDVEKTCTNLERIGAIKVYDAVRIITNFDNNNFLKNNDTIVRITQEDAVKVTMHLNNSDNVNKNIIKFKMNTYYEAELFLKSLGYDKISSVKARRISYEYQNIDFDIDIFPTIPSFMEMDIENITTTQKEMLIEQLELEDNEEVIMGTEEIHKYYNVEYFEEYRKN